MSTLSLRLHLLLRSSSKPKALQIFAGASTSLSYEGRPASTCNLYQTLSKNHRIHIMHTFSCSVDHCLHLFTLSLQLMKEAFTICPPPQGVCRVPRCSKFHSKTHGKLTDLGEGSSSSWISPSLPALSIDGQWKTGFIMVHDCMAFEAALRRFGRPEGHMKLLGALGSSKIPQQ